LCIAEKLNIVQRIRICDFNQVNYLITELNPADSVLMPYHNTNLEIL